MTVTHAGVKAEKPGAVTVHSSAHSGIAETPRIDKEEWKYVLHYGQSNPDTFEKSELKCV